MSAPKLHRAKWAKVARRYDGQIACLLFGISIIGAFKLMWIASIIF